VASSAEPAQPPPEEAALQAISRKDHRAALAVLMRAYGTELFRFCLDLVGDATAAEDLLQQTYADAFQSLPAWVPRASLRAWLYGIARHRCLDVLKERRRWLRVVEPQAELPEREDPAAPSDSRVHDKQLSGALDDCLQRLKPNAREVVLLRYRAQLSYDDIAEAVGEQPGTLRVRLARALPLLKRCLEEKGAGP
jgi:RNA polymerase sigma-70 factor (ECF subfamily)